MIRFLTNPGLVGLTLCGLLLVPSRAEAQTGSPNPPAASRADDSRPRESGTQLPEASAPQPGVAPSVSPSSAADGSTTTSPASAVPVNPDRDSGSRVSSAPPNLGAGGGTPAAGAPPSVPVDLIPYRVRVDTALNLGDQESPAQRRTLRDEIRDRLRGQVGGFWALEFPSELESDLASPADLARRNDASYAAYVNGPYDKVFALGVSQIANHWVVQAREWDGSLRLLGSVIERETLEPRDVAALAVEVLRSSFRPVTEIEQAKDGTITLRGRAARLSPHDAAWNPLRGGSVFEPYYRYLNKERLVDRVQRMPWTYLVCGEPVHGEGIAPAQTISGLRAAIGSRKRRVEPIGLGTPLTDSSTVVRLVTRPPFTKPIAGLEVVVRKERNVPLVAEGEPPPAPLARLVSDRRGEFILPTGLVPPGQPVWLTIYSGSQSMARVPFIPGMRPREELELSDDSLRLQVEGDIALLQARLVDQAAQRAVLLALARKRADEKNFNDASQILRQVSETFQPTGMLADLNTIRSPALKTARENRDRQTEARIKKLCDDTADIINAHFGPERIAELREEFAELKEVADYDARDAAIDAANAAAKAGGKKAGPKRKLPSPAQKGTPPNNDETKADEDAFGKD